MARAASVNEKLNVACIGVGGRGGANVGGVSGENMVAVCDVDEKRAGRNFTKFEKAKKYYDFRKMLDEMDKSIDAVVDQHARPHALSSGAPGDADGQARAIARSRWPTPPGNVANWTKLAKKMDVATQLGNQRHAYGGMRRIVEAVRGGVIGEIKEVYCFVGGSAACRPFHGVSRGAGAI